MLQNSSRIRKNKTKNRRYFQCVKIVQILGICVPRAYLRQRLKKGEKHRHRISVSYSSPKKALFPHCSRKRKKIHFCPFTQDKAQSSRRMLSKRKRPMGRPANIFQIPNKSMQSSILKKCLVDEQQNGCHQKTHGRRPISCRTRKNVTINTIDEK